MNTMNITDIARSLSRLDDDEADALVGVYAAPGREAYVAWVAEWKKALHEEVALIRSLKAVRRDKSQHVARRNEANQTRQAERAVAHNLLRIRLAGKRRSVAERTMPPALAA